MQTALLEHNLHLSLPCTACRVIAAASCGILFISMGDGSTLLCCLAAVQALAAKAAQRDAAQQAELAAAQQLIESQFKALTAAAPAAAVNTVEHADAAGEAAKKRKISTDEAVGDKCCIC
jgi:hypothetical protein